MTVRKPLDLHGEEAREIAGAYLAQTPKKVKVKAEAPVAQPQPLAEPEPEPEPEPEDLRDTVLYSLDDCIYEISAAPDGLSTVAFTIRGTTYAEDLGDFPTPEDALDAVKEALTAYNTR